ncbi:unnamed protein product [Prunus armeniaca]|uniref:Uncharacterized protein n=1 Tax=Prunus armeniaca TaxID=36596 RepID=A0A6J5U9F1_PRUAR|nr:unnamed protein product [Prunus armeniaca]
MAKLLLVSASALVFVILLLELRLAYSSAEPQRPIKAANTCSCSESKANFDKQRSAQILGMAAPRLRPLRILTNAGRDRDHPRKPSQASPKAPPGGHP